MRRRKFIGLFSGVATAWPHLLSAQQRQGVPRIGYLATASLTSSDAQAFFNAFRSALFDRGYAEPETIVIETRSAEGNVERFPALARQLVELKVDIIVALNSVSARAAQKATAKIPIVVAVMADPIQDGLVASLARPGRNITGLTFLAPELLPKLVTLVKEALPRLTRLAALWHPSAFSERTMTEMVKETEAAALGLGVRLRRIEVHGPGDIEQAFARIAEYRAEAVLVFPSPLLFNERRRIVELATKLRVPSIANAREFPLLGGFLSYGANLLDLNRRAATYVDKILKGATPNDLPVEQPTKFELVINFKTAKAFGLAVPEVLLARADEVIE